MNFLGHFVLAGNDDGLLAGNFTADWIKGNKHLSLPDNISRGVVHHRFIDRYTDTHASSSELIALMRESQGKYALVALDLAYDYLLASSFKEVTGKDLDHFAQTCYERLRKYLVHFPDQARLVYNYMSGNNWLTGYASIEGISRAFHGMSQRARPGNNLAEAPVLILNSEAAFRKHFLDFFGDMRTASETFLKNLP